MSDNQQLIISLLERGIPNANVKARETGNIYGFRVESGERVRWLYVDHVFLADRSADEITNLFDIHKVTEALQDERKPQKLYFNGVSVMEHRT